MHSTSALQSLVEMTFRATSCSVHGSRNSLLHYRDLNIWNRSYAHDINMRCIESDCADTAVVQLAWINNVKCCLSFFVSGNTVHNYMRWSRTYAAVCHLEITANELKSIVFPWIDESKWVVICRFRSMRSPASQNKLLIIVLFSNQTDSKMQDSFNCFRFLKLKHNY